MELYLYNSNYEPLPLYIETDYMGEPTYDPLKFAVKVAHKMGLEIHAWINTYRCFSR